MAWMPWVLGVGVLAAVAMLIASVGTLLRLDWARRLFIGTLVFAIVANLGGLWLQYELMLSLVTTSLTGTAVPTPLAELLSGFVTATRIMALMVTLGGCLVLTFIIRGLMSDEVKQEFA